MQPIYDESFEMMLQDVEVQPEQEGYHPVRLITSRGSVHYRYYPVTGAKVAAIWVGGVGGGWDTPAKGLYPQLALELKSEAIASLRVRFRYPTELLEAVLDVLAGLIYLQAFISLLSNPSASFSIRMLVMVLMKWLTKFIKSFEIGLSSSSTNLFQQACLTKCDILLRQIEDYAAGFQPHG